MKVLGKGSFGCVVKPQITCNTKKSKKNNKIKNKSKNNIKNKTKKNIETEMVSKITDDDNEYFISKKIIDYGKKNKINVDNYLCLIQDKCDSIDSLNNKIKKSCGIKNSTYLKINRIHLYSLNMKDCGVTIDSFIKEKKISSSQFEKYIIHLLKGLNILHKCNILHADIKEPNILILDNKPKFIDFGGSISVKNLSLNKFPYQIISTFSYRPPEIVFIFQIVSNVLNYYTYLQRYNHYQFSNLLIQEAGLDTTLNKNIFKDSEKIIGYYSNITSNKEFNKFCKEFKKNILKFDVYSLGKTFEYLIKDYKIPINQKILSLIENMTKLDFKERFSTLQCLKFINKK